MFYLIIFLDKAGCLVCLLSLLLQFVSVQEVVNVLLLMAVFALIAFLAFTFCKVNAAEQLSLRRSAIFMFLPANLLPDLLLLRREVPRPFPSTTA